MAVKCDSLAFVCLAFVANECARFHLHFICKQFSMFFARASLGFPLASPDMTHRPFSIFHFPKRSESCQLWPNRAIRPEMSGTQLKKIYLEMLSKGKFECYTFLLLKGCWGNKFLKNSPPQKNSHILWYINKIAYLQSYPNYKLFHWSINIFSIYANLILFDGTLAGTNVYLINICLALKIIEMLSI